MKRTSLPERWGSALLLVAIALMLGACARAPAEPRVVQLVPDPADPTTSPFFDLNGDIDDSYVELDLGFEMSFFGEEYTEVFLNTNGGLTFGVGNEDFDPAAADVTQPGIAVFWGDLDAAEYDGVNRPEQLAYQRFPDRFVIYYDDYQDNDEEAWDNTATVTLFPDGTIELDYGEVGSEDILVGVFDGTHADDRYVDVQAEYAGYTADSGVILFDEWGAGPPHAGELDGRTITFTP